MCRSIVIKNYINILLFAGSTAVVIAGLLLGSNAGAVSASDWRAGNIISDTEFTNKDSMSVQEIQSFLDSKIGTCDINGTQPATEYSRPDLTHAQYAASRGWPGPPYTCLNKYYEVPKVDAGGNMPANNYSNPDSIPPGAQSAAWIIKDAAVRFNISPKVLLIKIATESVGPLTGDKWPLLSQYRYAMGSHCPDSGPGGSANCDPAYAGFSIQMYSAASLMRWYLDSMDQQWWSYKKPYQTNSILWNVVETGCGAGNVHIENKATAALYTYTPYQPNQAALNNLYGTGDGCSAYGNRNFWRVFWDWFGNPQIGAAGNAITARYAEANNSNDLGAAVGTVTCGLKNSGCFQFYEKGAILWSPATGAWESFGPIRTQYGQLGFENSSLGYPVGPVYCGIKDGGCYQQYQSGYIVGSPASGWWNSTGAIRARWGQLGFENGTLGYPTGNEQCTLKNGGCFQFFQNGAIVGSPASGWWESMGPIREKWASLGFENGTLGYPTGPMSTQGDRTSQTYQNNKKIIYVAGSDTVVE